MYRDANIPHTALLDGPPLVSMAVLRKLFFRSLDYFVQHALCSEEWGTPILLYSSTTHSINRSCLSRPDRTSDQYWVTVVSSCQGLVTVTCPCHVASLMMVDNGTHSHVVVSVMLFGGFYFCCWTNYSCMYCITGLVGFLMFLLLLFLGHYS